MNRLPVIAHLILHQITDHSTVSGHKYTKFAIVSGFRTADDRSLLVSHFVTLTLTLTLRLLGHASTRGVFMYANNISDTAHFCSSFPSLKQNFIWLGKLYGQKENYFRAAPLRIN